MLRFTMHSSDEQSQPCSFLYSHNHFPRSIYRAIIQSEFPSDLPVLLISPIFPSQCCACCRSDLLVKLYDLCAGQNGIVRIRRDVQPAANYHDRSARFSCGVCCSSTIRGTSQLRLLRLVQKFGLCMGPIEQAGFLQQIDGHQNASKIQTCDRRRASPVSPTIGPTI